MESVTAARTGADIAPGIGDIERLRTRLRGEIVLPRDAGYDRLRRLWNGMVDKRPAAIIRCATAGDVVEAVNFARASGLLVAIRSGGHSIAGLSSCDGGLMIDLSAMKGIQVDPERRIARAEPGLYLGEFDMATQEFGLATTMGVNSDTGIAGLTLGGGLGRLARKHGLACDNLLAAELVLADGRLMTASETENPDLFWALRGGGGNFGVVTAFHYRLHLVGPAILGGLVLYEFRHARAALRHYHAFLSDAPDEVHADAVLLTSAEGAPMLGISCCYIGPVEEGERVLRPLRSFGQPTQDTVAPTTYAALQIGVDPLFPRGRRYYWKSHYLREIGDAAVDTLLEQFARVPSPMSLLVLQAVGGAAGRVGATETAYAHRDARYDCIPAAIWEDPAADEANIAWSRGVWEAMTPFATGGVYVNSLGDEGEERIRAAYGPNYARLVALKARYDPENLFRLNQNLRPAA
jgi:FAD/FMN-containing dehydrogenase